MQIKNGIWAIYVVWLFNISAIAGISLGFEEWFVTKTPLNLIISSLLFFLVFPVDNTKKGLIFGLLWFGGMFAEWIGIHYGILFGTYSYGANLGIKIDGVPVLIGINWALLTFITARIAQYLNKNSILQIFIGASLMLVIDFFMEQSAPRFDFWEFQNDVVPFKNYVSWFLIALLFHGVIKWTKITGDLRFSIHLYAAQLLFFVYFYIWF
ncbi:carotenoid biosynthesis protein [Muriicola sp.]|uniref:carotenoid biosynthesis protein n=1 Tax=Muriicola sp. TaxID=2020856 RepID=UPI003C70843B